MEELISRHLKFVWKTVFVTPDVLDIGMAVELHADYETKKYTAKNVYY